LWPKVTSKQDYALYKSQLAATMRGAVAAQIHATCRRQEGAGPEQGPSRARLTVLQQRRRFAEADAQRSKGTADLADTAWLLLQVRSIEERLDGFELRLAEVTRGLADVGGLRQQLCLHATAHAAPCEAGTTSPSDAIFACPTTARASVSATAATGTSNPGLPAPLSAQKPLVHPTYGFRSPLRALASQHATHTNQAAVAVPGEAPPGLRSASSKSASGCRTRPASAGAVSGTSGSAGWTLAPQQRSQPPRCSNLAHSHAAADVLTYKPGRTLLAASQEPGRSLDHRAEQPIPRMEPVASELDQNMDRNCLEGPGGCGTKLAKLSSSLRDTGVDGQRLSLAEEPWMGEVVDMVRSCLSHAAPGPPARDATSRTSRPGAVARTLSRAEFAELVLRHKPELRPQQLKRAFSFLNVSGSGRLTLAELQQCCPAQGLPLVLPELLSWVQPLEFLRAVVPTARCWSLAWYAGALRAVTVPDDAPTINAAINCSRSASPASDGPGAAGHVGGLVLVRPGVYSEAVRVTRSCTLLGLGPREMVVIEAPKTEWPLNFVWEESAWVVNMTIRCRVAHTRGQCINVAAGRPTLERCCIEGGVRAAGENTRAVLRCCEVRGSPGNGIHFTDRCGGGVLGCTVQLSGLHGILADRGAHPDVRGNSISRNKGAGLCIFLGRLKVMISSAEGLCSAGGLLGAPYCVCEIAGRPRSRFQTAVARDARNPTWGQEGVIDGYATGDSLLFRVYAVHACKEDTLLGSVELASLPAGGFEGDLRLPQALEGAQASLRVRVVEGVKEQPTMAPSNVAGNDFAENGGGDVSLLAGFQEAAEEEEEQDAPFSLFD